MEEIVKNEFLFYSKLAKPLVLNLPKSKDRILAAAWVKKFKDESSGEEKLRTTYLKLLLFCLQRRKLSGIFADEPANYPTLEELPEDIDLNEFARNLLEQEKLERREQIRLEMMGDMDAFPAFTTDCSPDLTEYVAAQDIPNFGVHIYYAISRQPVNKWQQSEMAILPKGTKSAIETSVTAAAAVSGCVCGPKGTASAPEVEEEPKEGEEAECRKKKSDKGPERKKRRPKKLGTSPPTHPIGEVRDPAEERLTPTWGTNLLEVRTRTDIGNIEEPSDEAKALEAEVSKLLEEEEEDDDDEEPKGREETIASKAGEMLHLVDEYKQGKMDKPKKPPPSRLSKLGDRSGMKAPKSTKAPKIPVKGMKKGKGKGGFGPKPDNLPEEFAEWTEKDLKEAGLTWADLMPVDENIDDELQQIEDGEMGDGGNDDLEIEELPFEINPDFDIDAMLREAEAELAKDRTVYDEGVEEDEPVVELFDDELADIHDAMDVSRAAEEVREASPAITSRIPVTTPERSSSPRRMKAPEKLYAQDDDDLLKHRESPLRPPKEKRLVKKPKRKKKPSGPTDKDPNLSRVFERVQKLAKKAEHGDDDDDLEEFERLEREFARDSGGPCPPRGGQSSTQSPGSPGGASRSQRPTQQPMRSPDGLDEFERLERQFARESGGTCPARGGQPPAQYPGSPFSPGEADRVRQRAQQQEQLLRSPEPGYDQFIEQFGGREENLSGGSPCVPCASPPGLTEDEEFAMYENMFERQSPGAAARRSPRPIPEFDYGPSDVGQFDPNMPYNYGPEDLGLDPAAYQGSPDDSLGILSPGAMQTPPSQRTPTLEDQQAEYMRQQTMMRALQQEAMLRHGSPQADEIIGEVERSFEEELFKQMAAEANQQIDESPPPGVQDYRSPRTPPQTYEIEDDIGIIPELLEEDPYASPDYLEDMTDIFDRCGGLPPEQQVCPSRSPTPQPSQMIEDTSFSGAAYYTPPGTPNAGPGSPCARSASPQRGTPQPPTPPPMPFFPGISAPITPIRQRPIPRPPGYASPPMYGPPERPCGYQSPQGPPGRQYGPYERPANYATPEPIEYDFYPPEYFDGMDMDDVEQPAFESPPPCSPPPGTPLSDEFTRKATRRRPTAQRAPQMQPRRLFAEETEEPMEPCEPCGPPEPEPEPCEPCLPDADGTPARKKRPKSRGKKGRSKRRSQLDEFEELERQFEMEDQTKLPCSRPILPDLPFSPGEAARVRQRAQEQEDLLRTPPTPEDDEFERLERQFAMEDGGGAPCQSRQLTPPSPGAAARVQERARQQEESLRSPGPQKRQPREYTPIDKQARRKVVTPAPCQTPQAQAASPVWSTPADMSGPSRRPTGRTPPVYDSDFSPPPTPPRSPRFAPAKRIPKRGKYPTPPSSSPCASGPQGRQQGDYTPIDKQARRKVVTPPPCQTPQPQQASPAWSTPPGMPGPSRRPTGRTPPVYDSDFSPPPTPPRTPRFAPAKRIPKRGKYPTPPSSPRTPPDDRDIPSAYQSPAQRAPCGGGGATPMRRPRELARRRMFDEPDRTPTLPAHESPVAYDQWDSPCGGAAADAALPFPNLDDEEPPEDMPPYECTLQPDQMYFPDEMMAAGTPEQLPTRAELKKHTIPRDDLRMNISQRTPFGRGKGRGICRESIFAFHQMDPIAEYESDHGWMRDLLSNRDLATFTKYNQKPPSSCPPQKRKHKHITCPPRPRFKSPKTKTPPPPPPPPPPPRPPLSPWEPPEEMNVSGYGDAFDEVFEANLQVPLDQYPPPPSFQPICPGARTAAVPAEDRFAGSPARRQRDVAFGEAARAGRLGDFLAEEDFQNIADQADLMFDYQGGILGTSPPPGDDINQYDYYGDIDNACQALQRSVEEYDLPETPETSPYMARTPPSVPSGSPRTPPPRRAPSSVPQTPCGRGAVGRTASDRGIPKKKQLRETRSSQLRKEAAAKQKQAEMEAQMKKEKAAKAAAAKKKDAQARVRSQVQADKRAQAEYMQSKDPANRGVPGGRMRPLDYRYTGNRTDVAGRSAEKRAPRDEEDHTGAGARRKLFGARSGLAQQGTCAGGGPKRQLGKKKMAKKGPAYPGPNFAEELQQHKIDFPGYQKGVVVKGKFKPMRRRSHCQIGHMDDIEEDEQSPCGTCDGDEEEEDGEEAQYTAALKALGLTQEDVAQPLDSDDYIEEDEEEDEECAPSCGGSPDALQALEDQMAEMNAYEAQQNQFWRDIAGDLDEDELRELGVTRGELEQEGAPCGICDEEQPGGVDEQRPLSQQQLQMLQQLDEIERQANELAAGSPPRSPVLTEFEKIEQAIIQREQEEREYFEKLMRGEIQEPVSPDQSMPEDRGAGGVCGGAGGSPRAASPPRQQSPCQSRAVTYSPPRPQQAFGAPPYQSPAQHLPVRSPSPQRARPSYPPTPPSPPPYPPELENLDYVMPPVFDDMDEQDRLQPCPPCSPPLTPERVRQQVTSMAMPQFDPRQGGVLQRDQRRAMKGPCGGMGNVQEEEPLIPYLVGAEPPQEDRRSRRRVREEPKKKKKKSEYEDPELDRYLADIEQKFNLPPIDSPCGVCHPLDDSIPDDLPSPMPTYHPPMSSPHQRIPLQEIPSLPWEESAIAPIYPFTPPPHTEFYVPPEDMPIHPDLADLAWYEPPMNVPEGVCPFMNEQPADDLYYTPPRYPEIDEMELDREAMLAYQPPQAVMGSCLVSRKEAGLETPPSVGRRRPYGTYTPAETPPSLGLLDSPLLAGFDDNMITTPTGGPCQQDLQDFFLPTPPQPPEPPSTWSPRLDEFERLEREAEESTCRKYQQKPNAQMDYKERQRRMLIDDMAEQSDRMLASSPCQREFDQLEQQVEEESRGSRRSNRRQQQMDYREIQRRTMIEEMAVESERMQMEYARPPSPLFAGAPSPSRTPPPREADPCGPCDGQDDYFDQYADVLEGYQTPEALSPSWQGLVSSPGACFDPGLMDQAGVEQRILEDMFFNDRPIGDLVSSPQMIDEGVSDALAGYESPPPLSPVNLMAYPCTPPTPPSPPPLSAFQQAIWEQEQEDEGQGIMEEQGQQRGMFMGGECAPCDVNEGFRQEQPPRRAGPPTLDMVMEPRPRERRSPRQGPRTPSPGPAAAPRARGAPGGQGPCGGGAQRQMPQQPQPRRGGGGPGGGPCGGNRAPRQAPVRQPPQQGVGGGGVCGGGQGMSVEDFLRGGPAPGGGPNQPQEEGARRRVRKTSSVKKIVTRRNY